MAGCSVTAWMARTGLSPHSTARRITWSMWPRSATSSGAMPSVTRINRPVSTPAARSGLRVASRSCRKEPSRSMVQ